MVTCKECKHFNESTLYGYTFCALELPSWVSRLLTVDQWEASRHVKPTDQCDLGEKVK
jgi:hypothetical protein